MTSSIFSFRIVRAEKTPLQYFLIVCAGVLFLAEVLIHVRYTPDDAFIYFQYAKKIAQGSGFSFNQNTPSYGVTGPLWAIILAAGKLLSFNLFVYAKVIDIACALASLVVFYRLMWLILFDRLLATIATLVFTFDVWFLRWTSSAMDTSCAVFLMLSVLYNVFLGRPKISALFAGLLTLVRPECALLFVLIFVYFILFQKGELLKLSLKLILTFCLVVVPWLIFSYFHFGTIVPNSFLSKTGGAFTLRDGVEGVTAISKIILSSQFPAAIGVLFAGWYLFHGGIREEFKAQWLLFVWIGALFLFYVIDDVQVVSRYLLIVMPCLIILGIWGISKLYEAKPRTLSYILLIFFLFTFVQNQFIYWTVVKPHTDNFTWGTEHCLKPIALWLRHNTSDSTKVVVPDIGAIGYYSDRIIYDPAGLVTPKVREAFRGFGYDEGMKERKYQCVVEPEFVIDRSEQPERLASTDLIPVMTRVFPGLGIKNTNIIYFTLYKVAAKNRP